MAVFRVVIVCVLLVTTAAVAVSGRFVGGRTEMKDVERSRVVQELGKFSVEEFNRNFVGRGNSGEVPLEFSKVVAAERQVVSGIKYYLTIEARRNGVIKVFESVVVVQPRLRRKELLSFSPSTGPLRRVINL